MALISKRQAAKIMKGSMTFSAATTGGQALGIFIIPFKRGFYHPPFGKGGRGGIGKDEQENLP
jgi:hypothetical protein